MGGGEGISGVPTPGMSESEAPQGTAAAPATGAAQGGGVAGGGDQAQDGVEILRVLTLQKVFGAGAKCCGSICQQVPQSMQRSFTQKVMAAAGAAPMVASGNLQGKDPRGCPWPRPRSSPREPVRRV